MQEFIDKNNLFDKDDQLLVAVSGGVDSVVAAFLLNECGYKIVLAHCNFGLRGEASDLDEEFVEELAVELKVPFSVAQFDTRQYCKENKISIQMGARKLRYSWLKETALEKDCSFIVMAHHATDQVESILMNMLRGTGIRGYYGMLPKNGKIVRPLLFASRQEIQDFADQQSLNWREDESNQEIYYERNLIRHNVLPELRKITPGLESAFFENSKRAAGAFKIFQQEIERFAGQCLTKTDQYISIDLPLLLQKEQPDIYLNEWLRPYGFNYALVKEVTKLYEAPPGRKVAARNFQVFKDRETLLICPVFKNKPAELEISQADQKVRHGDMKLELKVVPRNEMTDLNLPSGFCLDFDKLKFPLKLRLVGNGDQFRPLGMEGSKKVSDYLTDEKVPVPLKERTRILESEGVPAVLIGHREDEQFKVDENTKNVLIGKFSFSSSK